MQGRLKLDFTVTGDGSLHQGNEVVSEKLILLLEDTPVDYLIYSLQKSGVETLKIDANWLPLRKMLGKISDDFKAEQEKKMMQWSERMDKFHAKRKQKGRPHPSALIVELHQGRNFPPMDGDNSDPYVLLRVTKAVRRKKALRSSTQMDTLRPVWNETFTFFKDNGVMSPQQDEEEMMEQEDAADQQPLPPALMATFSHSQLKSIISSWIRRLGRLL